MVKKRQNFENKEFKDCRRVLIKHVFTHVQDKKDGKECALNRFPRSAQPASNPQDHNDEREKGW